MNSNSSSFQIHILGEGARDVANDNVDVEVQLHDGRRFVATFFTLRNLESLFEKNKRSGECRSGTYLWASDMILVEELSKEAIERTVEGLLEDGEFEAAFLLLG